MSSTGSLLKPAKKVSSAKAAPAKQENVRLPQDPASVDFDLISQLTYMAAVSSSGASRDKVLALTVEQPFVTAAVFRRVFRLAKQLGFEYARAFQLVASEVSPDNVRSLLLRFSSSIGSGAAESDFLREETRVELERYSAQYERAAESLRKWSDAYAALMVSVGLVVVVAMISMLLYELSNATLVVLGGIMICLTAVGVYIIARSAPVEVFTYDGPDVTPAARRAARMLFALGLPLAAIGAVTFAPTYGLGAILLSLGLAILPAGIAAYLDDRRVQSLDHDLPNTIRTLGAVAGSIGSTIAMALERLDRKSLGHLEKPLNRLQRALSHHVAPHIAWNRFVQETGSELIRRTVRAFSDATTIGAPPEKVGDICSAYALQNVILRAKRRLVSETFAYLTFPLHAAMTGLLIFVLQIVIQFNSKLLGLIQEASATALGTQAIGSLGLPMFQAKDLTVVINLIHAVVVLLTIANGLVARFATGGHVLKNLFYLGITLSLSGINLIFIPALTAKLFHI